MEVAPPLLEFGDEGEDAGLRIVAVSLPIF